VEAYEILSDPEERDKYDRGEDINVNMGGRRSGFNPFGNRGGGGGGGTKFHFNF
jgi:DnaJ family protein C protein 3